MIPLVLAGNAGAVFLGDGAVPQEGLVLDSALGGWDLPADRGACITGIAADGSLTIDTSITSRPDCIARNFPAYTTKLQCGNPANPDGAHFMANTCIRNADNVAISLKDLDRTKSMCEQQGAPGEYSWKEVCTSSWTSLGPSGNGTDGFCYTKVRLALFTDEASCLANGFGYSWDNTSGTYECHYAYGIAGVADTKLTRLDGTTGAAAGDTVDLNGLTMGQCLLLGGGGSRGTGTSFSNHTTMGGTAVVSGATIATPITGVRGPCLACHNNTSQYNGYAGRWKSNYLRQGHKNQLRKVIPGNALGGVWENGEFVVYPEWREGAEGPAAGIYNWASGTITFLHENSYHPANTSYPLLYITGGMNPVTEPIIWDSVTNKAYLNDFEGGYGCSACHATGWRDSNGVKGICSLSRYNNLQDNCVANGGTWYPMSGVEGYAIGGAEPAASFPAYAIGPDYGYGPTIPNITGQWDHDGINCNRCHMVAFDPSHGPTGAPPGYTTHETDIFNGFAITNICYGCHQSGPAKENNGTGLNNDLNHPEAIPVRSAATSMSLSGHVIGNSFLNSPHGQFTGSVLPNPLGKYDLVGGGTFASDFAGKVCRSSTTAGGGSVLETTATGGIIKSLEDCNRANGKPEGDAANYGYWQDEDGGACTTCHNVHESLFLADSHEPLKRECTTCHENPVSGMRHPIGANTPQGLAEGNEAKACEICHMPRNGSNTTDGIAVSGTSMHLWRINTSADYRTVPTAAEYATRKIANVAPDGDYANAVWVDLDYACGQCHGGSYGAGATKNAPYYDKATLAAFAEGIHVTTANAAPVAAFAAGTPSVAGYVVTVTDASTDDAAFPAGAVTVNWGNGSTSTGDAGGTFTKTYATAGVFTITLTVRDAGGLFSTAPASVSVPTKFSVSGTIFDRDGTTGLAGVAVFLKQNGSTKAYMTTPAGGAYSFANLNPGTYQVQVYKYGYIFDGDPVTVGNQNPITVTVGPAATGKDFIRQ